MGVSLVSSGRLGSSGMRSFLLGSAQVGALALSALALVGCSDVKLTITPTVQVSSLSANFPQVCAQPPTTQTSVTKVLFLVDMSGSNQSGNNGDGVGTDPDKSFRFGSISNFVQANIANKNIYYGFIAFQGAGGVALINDGSTADATFTNDPNVMMAALTQFQGLTDSGATPYKAALAMANTSIALDRVTAKAANVTPYYAVVMLSDGVPSDYSSPINDAAIDADVASLIVTGGEATLSTVYYGPAVTTLDMDAASRLQRMAVDGGGGFSNTNVDGRNVPLTDIIAFSNNNPLVIKQFMVTNVTSAPCDDGTMGIDSDADGLCDKDEIAYNTSLAKDPIEGPRMKGHTFNPTSRNSFGNVYNDYINYRTIKYGEAVDTNCTTTTSTSADLLNDCEKLFVSSTTPDGPTTPWTAAMGTTGDPKNFDSDGDGFLDYIELIFGRSRSAGMDFNSTNTSIQGYTMSQILLQHRNPINPSNAVAYDPDFHFTQANDAGQNCYSYTQSVLPLYHTQALLAANSAGFTELAHAADENVILIYYIQTAENAPNGAGELHYQFQKIKYGTSGLNLNLDPSSFQVYTATGVAKVSAAQ